MQQGAYVYTARQILEELGYGSASERVYKTAETKVYYIRKGGFIPSRKKDGGYYDNKTSVAPKIGKRDWKEVRPKRYRYSEAARKVILERVPPYSPEMERRKKKLRRRAAN